MLETSRTLIKVARFGCKNVREWMGVYAFLFLILSGKFVVAQSSELRTWQDLSGKFSVQATLETVTNKEITLKKPDGQTVVLPRGRLSKDNQEFINVSEAVKVIASQATKVEPHLQKLQSEPRSAIEAIAAIQKSEMRDPAAMLWCGVAFASEGGRPGLDKAEKYHDDAILRLRLIHKHMPQAHPRTLVSALNNRAILALRDRKANRATALFKEIATVEPALPYFVSHNIQVLLDVTRENRILELATAERRMLTELAAMPSTSNSPLPLPRRFVYSTDFNSNQAATTKIATNRLLALREQRIWPELTCFVCGGTGVIDCAKCVGGVTTAYTKEQVAFNEVNKTPIMGTKVFRVSCDFCHGKSGFDCPNCQGGRLPLD